MTKKLRIVPRDTPPTLFDIVDRLDTAHTFALGIEGAVVGLKEIGGDAGAVQLLLQRHQDELRQLRIDLEEAVEKRGDSK